MPAREVRETCVSRGGRNSRAGLLGLLIVGCTAPEGPRATFDRRVAPILADRCAAPACHGVAPGAEAAGEVIDWTRFHLPVDARGRLSDLDRAYAAAKRCITTADAPAFSTLLRKPLATSFGGLPHLGRDNFPSVDDPAYATVLDWIAEEVDGGEDQPPLMPAEQQFADTVQPALVAGMCTNAACHGTETAVPFRLDPGLGGAFSRAATRANYAAALTMLSLDGWPEQSRLVRKGLPLHAGGIVHKGGNTALFTGRDDPRVRAIVEWACAERAARLGRPCAAPGAVPVEAFVFVRGPAVVEPDVFDLDVFAPGSDLFLARVADAGLAPVSIENLTATLHDEPADVRDPAVSPDGERVAFAMRLSASGGHDLYELELATGRVRRLTEDAGPLPDGGLRTHRDPTYGPDGSIWFVSTRAGVVADDGVRLDADLYQLGPTSGPVRRRTFTPHIERKPVFFVHGEENGGEVAFTALRGLVASQARAHSFRFPPGLATEYHQHFGITPPETLFHDTRELPDGRYVSVVGHLDAPGGELGVIDRNFGPELSPGAPSALPSYAAPLVRLGEAGLDPAPLPDGRLLVTAGGADPRVEVWTLAEAVDGGGPRVVARETLVDAPGLADRDAEPVFRRQPPPREADAGDPVREGMGRETRNGEVGLLLHQGLPMIDAVLETLEPSGSREPRSDMVSVRVVESLPLTPAERAPVPVEETRHGLPGATTTSLGPMGPQRVLAELPLAADGTFQVELPPGVAFRLQALDAAGMTVGVTHNRWFHLEPGQVLRQGVAPADYDARCGACHGAADGDPRHAFPAPDGVSGASTTLSRFHGRDPRRPIEPVRTGDATRISVDFARDVRPILAARCAGCHGGPEPAGGLSLTAAPTEHYDDAYESLLAPGAGSRNGWRYVDATEARARHSHLVEVLTGQELDAPGRLAAPGASHGGLDPPELATIVRWIELGATWGGGAE